MKSIYFLILISFSGAFLLSLPAGSIIQKLPIILLAIFLMFQKSFYIYKEYLSLFLLLLFFYVYAIGSNINFSSSLVQALIITAPYLTLFCLFLIMSKIDFNHINVVNLKKIFLIIFFIQILFAFIKLGILGRVDEGFLIGTMSHNAGQLSFLFPALCIPIFVFMYAKKNIFFCIFLILLALLFGFINEKRSIIYLGPVIILFSFLMNSAYRIKLRDMAGSGFVFIIFGFLLLQFSSLIPSLSGSGQLNRGQALEQVGQLTYLFTYAYEYLFADFDSALQDTFENAIFNQNVQLGRLTLLIRSWELFLSSDFTTQLLGGGFGSYSYNEWTFSNQDRFFEENLFRGAFSGLLIILLEVGYVGLIFHLLIFYSLIKKIRFNTKNIRTDSYKRWSRICYVFLFIFAYDFFFYSTVLFRTLPMPFIFILIYMSLVYVLHLENNLTKEQNSRTNY
tara:strand:+ start:928 stop:2277 length:1350 start_codon:yes stop_codon:yes gene_type:complete